MFQNDLNAAIEEVLQGRPVGLPTETVYGLAARIDNHQAIASIFKLKERPFFDPLIVHVGSIDQARSLVSWWPAEAQMLCEALWPGPLTLVLPKADHVDNLITSGLDTVAIRWPRQALFQKVLDKVKVPLAAPSANKFGRTSPTEAQHVRNEFKNDPVFVLDGGPCDIGIESTVLKIQKKGTQVQLAILRKGAVSEKEIRHVLKNSKLDFIAAVDAKDSPGHMKHHYMPSIPFVVSWRRNDLNKLSEEIFEKISLLPAEIEHVKIQSLSRPPQKMAELKLSQDPRLATREFYSQLRKLAEGGSECIIYFKEVRVPSDQWEALYDRMDKAATLILKD